MKRATQIADVMDEPPASADPSSPLTEMLLGEPKYEDRADADTLATYRGPSLPDWHPMDTARKDGKPLWLRGPDGETVEATWRQSRRIVNTPKGYAWENYFTWTAINSGGLVMFEPIGWRPTTGAPHP